MNPRIRTLAEQAGIKLPADDEYNGHVHRNAIERFARSIVKECSQYIEDTVDFCGDEFIVAEKLLEHFGVEE